MRALIIYYSNYKGHTKQIAEAIGNVVNAELIKAEEFKSNDLENYDLIGIGSGVYNQKQHPIIADIIEKTNFENKTAFVFSTSAAGIDMYNKSIVDLLISKGAVIKGSFSCKGFYINKLIKIIGGVAKGHPDANDIANAKIFANKLNSLLTEDKMQ